MNKSEQNKEIAIKWFEAFNSKNLERLLELYIEEAQHYSPKLKIKQPFSNGIIKGKPSLRAWWEEAFKNLPSLKYEVVKLTADEDQVFMEYTRLVDEEPPLSVGEVLEIENGKIIASRVYHG